MRGMDENPFQSPEAHVPPSPKSGWRPGHLTSVLVVVTAIYLVNVMLFPRVPETMQAVSFWLIAIGLIWIVVVLGVKAVLAIRRLSSD
jgi:hypothetical protein